MTRTVGTDPAAIGVDPSAGTAPAPANVPTWQQIAEDYGKFLFTVAFRLTNDRHDAEDLVQETLLRVRTGLASYVPGSLEGWLARIVTNLFIDQARRRQRRPVQLLAEPDLGHHLPDAPAAEEAWAGSVLPGDLQDALTALPLDYRVAVVLCDVAGRSYQEIADTLDLPIGTVRSRIHRGRQALRDRLVTAAAAEGRRADRA